jgi:cytochrome P450
MVILAAALVVLLFLLAKRSHHHRGPRGWPIVGHLPFLLRKDFHRVLRSWSHDYGAVYRINIFGMPGVVVTDPASIATILCRSKEVSEVPKHDVSYRELNILWGGKPSLFTSSTNETWKLVRKAVASSLSSAKLR